MSRIKLLVDSGSDIPEWYAEKYDITIVPLTITFGNKQFTDYYELNSTNFYKELENSDSLPTTSQPNPHRFIEYFKKFEGSYDSIICVTMSSNGSGTYNSARLAAEEYNSDPNNHTRVKIFDSHQASLGLTLFLDRALTMIKDGLSADEIFEKLENIRPYVSSYFIPHTLEYLRKGGRVNTVTAVLGEILGIRPVITVLEGWGRNYDKVRGRSGTINRLFELFSSQHADNRVFISHADNKSAANELYKKLTEAFSNLEVTISQMGSTMGTHAGPGTLGLHFVRAAVHSLDK